ncbi:hypothetical protein COL5a_011003 [Colletotrichum fioriniae]|nr:hypothetical protein COL5a_011003 [Colletotrichum fioriniae]KAJ3939433.1 hypothetical protein N0V96_010207 [Colletotrichum fioriniae]
MNPITIDMVKNLAKEVYLQAKRDEAEAAEAARDTAAGHAALSSLREAGEAAAAAEVAPAASEGPAEEEGEEEQEGDNSLGSFGEAMLEILEHWEGST